MEAHRFMLVACDWCDSTPDTKKVQLRALGIVPLQQRYRDTLDVEIVWPRQVEGQKRAKVPRSELVVLNQNFDLVELDEEALTLAFGALDHFWRKAENLQAFKKMARAKIAS